LSHFTPRDPARSAAAAAPAAPCRPSVNCCARTPNQSCCHTRSRGSSAFGSRPILPTVRAHCTGR